MSFAGIDDKKLLRAFLEESEELLEKLNDNLLRLEKDTGNPESINEVFRLTHSLKSESALVGFTHLSELAHRLEDVFDKIRGQSLALSRPLMDAIFSASDLIHEIISRISIGQNDTEVDSRSVIRELTQLAELGSSAEGGKLAGGDVSPGERGLSLDGFQRSQITEARDRGEKVYELAIKVSKEAEIRYPRAYLVFNNLEMIANVIQTSPDMAVAQDDSLYGRLVVLLSSDLPEEDLLKACAVDLVEEPVLEALDSARVEELLSVSRHMETEQSSIKSAGMGRIESTSVRVDTSKLNEIWQLVGELTIYKAQLTQLHDRVARQHGNESIKGEVERASDSLDRITTEMQQAIMGTRMVPIAVLFNKFPRLVRDLSRKLGKKVELEIQGKETEIDRTIVEVLSDPLTHIIRNSLDHGLEEPEDRRRVGKPEEGRIAISAHQQGGKIVIEIADDGRGLNVEKIRKKAGVGEEVGDEEVVQYIFSPGFSTKEDVTDLSGRGVGMDVVATRIREDLKGEVEVGSDAGRGMLTRIVLPLTLTILHSLVISCGGYYYAIPVQDINETVKVTGQDIRREGKGELYLYDGQEMPLLRLEAVLLAPPDDGSPAPENNGVVVEQRRGRVCLLVDELVEEEDLVIKPISDLLNHRRLFSGISVLGDGRIIFILDTARIIEVAESGGFDGV